MTYVLKNMMFIHIPKTGGHVVWKIFEPLGGVRLKDHYGFGNGFPLHGTALGLHTNLGSTEYRKYDKFALVRNPWERAVSLYFGQDNVTKFSRRAFKTYLRRMRRGSNRRFSPFQLQSAILSPEVTVFDLSRIDELYEWVADHGFSFENPGVIPSGKNKDIERPHYRKYFNEAFQRAIGKMNAADIERFGWTF